MDSHWFYSNATRTGVQVDKEEQSAICMMMKIKHRTHHRIPAILGLCQQSDRVGLS